VSTGRGAGRRFPQRCSESEKHAALLCDTTEHELRVAIEEDVCVLAETDNVDTGEMWLPLVVVGLELAEASLSASLSTAQMPTRERKGGCLSSAVTVTAAGAYRFRGESKVEHRLTAAVGEAPPKQLMMAPGSEDNFGEALPP